MHVCLLQLHPLTISCLKLAVHVIANNVHLPTYSRRFMQLLLLLALPKSLFTTTLQSQVWIQLAYNAETTTCSALLRNVQNLGFGHMANLLSQIQSLAQHYLRQYKSRLPTCVKKNRAQYRTQQPHSRSSIKTRQSHIDIFTRLKSVCHDYLLADSLSAAVNQL